MVKSRAYLTRSKEIVQCELKVPYYEHGAALRVARKLSYGASVYRCPGKKGEARHFHVTSNKVSW